MTAVYRYAIIDLQFGSTGKGLLAGHLANNINPDTVVCAFGPNAGHTYVDKFGRKYVHIMLPMGALSRAIKSIMFGPGAIVHPELLMAEAEAVGVMDKLVIHENAAVVLERHREAEAGYGFSIGSTMKGTGEALIEKITRKGSNTAGVALKGTRLEGNVVSVPEYNDIMDKASVVQIEGAQGHSLSFHHGFYPHVTSRDCSVAQLIADCAIPMVDGPIHVFGCVRTYPIRVAHRYKPCDLCMGTGELGFDMDSGKFKKCTDSGCVAGQVQVGHSGPCYPDQQETTWEAIGQPTEYTTVTKLPRRVFTFSEQQVAEAVRLNAVDKVFLNFCNYATQQRVDDLAEIMHKLGAPVSWFGYGPTENDVRRV